MIINDRIRKLGIHQFYERVQVPSSTLKAQVQPVYEMWP